MFNLEIVNEFIDKKAINSFTVNEKHYQMDIKLKKKMTRMLRNAGIITFVFFLIVGFITTKSFTIDIPFPIMMLLITLFFGSFAASKDEFKPIKREYLFYDDKLMIYKEEDFDEYSSIIQLDKIKYKDISEVSFNKIDKKMIIKSKFIETLSFIIGDTSEEYEITHHEIHDNDIIIYFNDESSSDLISNFDTNAGIKVNVI